jgi:hypothetical protein
MAGEDVKTPPMSSVPITTIPVAAGVPPPTVPTVFADGIANIAPSGHVVKFYLFRSDPDAAGQPQYKNQVVAQIAMSTIGFLHMAAFFERAVKHYTESGTFSREMVQAMRKMEGLDP